MPYPKHGFVSTLCNTSSGAKYWSPLNCPLILFNEHRHNIFTTFSIQPTSKLASQHSATYYRYPLPNPVIKERRRRCGAILLSTNSLRVLIVLTLTETECVKYAKSDLKAVRIHLRNITTVSTTPWMNPRTDRFHARMSRVCLPKHLEKRFHVHFHGVKYASRKGRRSLSVANVFERA